MRLPCFGLLLAIPVVLTAHGDEPTSTSRIEGLIHQLGSDSAALRDGATRQLMKLDEAAPALRLALRSPDAEVRRRVRSILEALSRRYADRQLSRARADARAGRAGLLAERLARSEAEPDGPRSWQPVMDLCWGLRDLFPAHFGKVKGLGRSYLRLRKEYDLRPAISPKGEVVLRRNKFGKPATYVARGVGVSAMRGAAAAIFVSAGGATLSMGLQSFVVATGPVRCRDGLAEKLVVISEADVDMEVEIVRDCLVVARGSVTCGSMRNCVVLAGGDVHLNGGADGCLIKCRGKATRKYPKYVRNTTLLENDPRAVSCVRFFETRDVGVEVEPSKPAVLVAKVTEGPFSKAGLRRKDRIFELDGKAVGSPEEFRCALRRRVAEGGTATLKLRRDERWMSLSVRMP